LFIRKNKRPVDGATQFELTAKVTAPILPVSAGVGACDAAVFCSGSPPGVPDAAGEARFPLTRALARRALNLTRNESPF
jgi:hypothetical protein